MKRIVVKVGTNVITRSSGLLNHPVMKALVAQIAALKRKGIQVILVSSGAMAAGRARLGKARQHADTVLDRQILASVGQVKLMETYARLFRAEGYHCAQVLATKGDFRDRQHYLCMKECFTTLLHDNIIPIANENDVVSVKELMFTDNDELAGLVAGMLNVDALLLLTSVEGLYDRNPKEEGAQLIASIAADDEAFHRYAVGGETSSFGRGGMHTKCRVAKKLSSLGIATHIVNGLRPNVLKDVVNQKPIGTTFVAKRRASGVKKWIAHAEGQEKGTITVNAQAEAILSTHDRARSILPVGVTAVSGAFEKGDIIRIIGESGTHLGYGVAQYGEARARELLGKKNQKPIVHYDYLFLQV